MSGQVFYNILFIAAVVALVVVLWRIMSGRRRKGRQPDETMTVAGRFQTGLAHRFNTPEIRR